MRLPVIIINDCWEYIIEVEVSMSWANDKYFKVLLHIKYTRALLKRKYKIQNGAIKYKIHHGATKKNNVAASKICHHICDSK